MTNETTKRRRVSRRALTALAACAVLCLSVVGVNAATDGAVMGWVVSVLGMEDPFHTTGTLADGTVVDITIQNAWVEERDGRAILVMPHEEVDITEALEADGIYQYAYTADGYTLRAEVTGTAADWTITVELDTETGEHRTYTFCSDPEIADS